MLCCAPLLLPRSQAVLLSEKRGKERAARLAAARAGKPAPAGGKPKKTEAQKKVAADFYKQVRINVECRRYTNVQQVATSLCW